MELPSTHHFQGWNIRYSLMQSPSTPTPNHQNSQQTKSILFVHGTPWSSSVFHPLINALLSQTQQSYQILVYDLPGYGQSQGYTSPSPSPSPPSSNSAFQGDTSVKSQASALASLLKHVQLATAPEVIAHDIAGSIVLRAHLLLNCDFGSMLLVDTNCVLPWGDGFYTLVRSTPSPFTKLPPAIFSAMLRAVIRSACHKPDAAWEDKLARPWSGSDEAQSNFVRQIAQANDADIAEMLDGDLYAHVRCDVKIIWGEEDQWIPREKIEDLIERLGSRVKESVFIPEAGHLVMLDQPERFAIEVFCWLTRAV